MKHALQGASHTRHEEGGYFGKCIEPTSISIYKLIQQCLSFKSCLNSKGIVARSKS